MWMRRADQALACAAGSRTPYTGSNVTGFTRRVSKLSVTEVGQ
jgi:hypothetical protein